jgi:hypothetical protein
MGTRSRSDRAAAVILVIVGVALLSSAAVTFVPELPAILGAEGEHMAGDATLWVLLTSLPMTVGGLIALVSARKLWRSSPLGRALALVFVVFAGMIAGEITAAGGGNILSAAKVILLESGRWSLSWPMLGVTGVDGATYYGYLDNVTFWIPGIVALCALLVTCLLLAGWIAGRARGARSS